MRLKSLTLHGYKTFASKTVFHFGTGITAIIGPNGSGKSNIADAIRWALGEQQFSLLRGKKTEDMIFAGSARRPRASFAEVTLTFDNSDHFFPIAYSEIAISRRAYRDGVNEYTLNGNRVRLRDITDLLAHSGLAERTYTVIGQGLVDHALAQKPEERRALFEEAAGIATYRSRREEALRKLEETRHNLERAQDILREVEPRLRQLTQQAERARRHRELRQALLEQSQVWLGWQYRALRDRLQRATAARDLAQQQQAEARTALESAEQSLVALRQQRAQLQEQIAEVQRERDAAQRTYTVWLRERDVLRERLNALERQEADARAELSALAAEREAAQARLDEAAQALHEAQALLHQCTQALQEALDAAATRSLDRDHLEAQRQQAQQLVEQRNQALLEAQRALAAAQARRHALQDQLDALTRRAAALAEQREADMAALQRIREAIQHDTAQATLFDAQYESAQRALTEAQQYFAQTQAALAAAEAEEKLAARVTLFAKLRAQQYNEDLASAAAALGLNTFRGLLSDFLQVAPEAQKAVGAALDRWMSALVLDAEPDHVVTTLPQLRDWLRARADGNITIAPLPIMRDLSPTLNASQREQMRARGVRPMIEMVSAPEWLRPALGALFGNVFFAPDLETALRFCQMLDQHGMCVTREGEVVLASGGLILRPDANTDAATPDAPEIDQPLDPEAIRAQLEAAQTAHRAAQQQLAQVRRQFEEASQTRQIFTREINTRQRRLEETEQKIARSEEALAEMAAGMAQLEQEIAQLDAQIAQSGLHVQHCQQALQQAQAALQTATQQLNEFLHSGELETLNRLRAEAAAAQKTVENREALHQERARRCESLRVQQESRLARTSALQADRELVAQQFAEAERALAQSEAQLQRATEALQPLRAALAQCDQQAEAIEAQRHQLEQQLRTCDAQLNAALVELTRLEDERTNLIQRAAELLAEMQSSAEPDLSAAAALLETLPATEPPTDIESRIAQLRRQIRQLGAINEEAEAEYAALRERYDFITAQCADLEQAAERLQHVIAELNDTMRKAFHETFEMIASAFQHTFKALFGGGQARLSLVNADNLDECGVEIQAQPPGKRPQSLALLSGGERSLTATALLFAILQVKPTPFCVLDEVDAALDENNVGRIRDMLERLSDQTQFIIITHNRRTVEAADTIYGISMGADGASTALSLRLDPA